jgi:hypothetical protein
LIEDVAVENFDRKSVSRHLEKNFRRKGAVKNNPNRFPAGYVIELDEDEKNELVENFHRFNRLKQFVGAGHAGARTKVFVPAIKRFAGMARSYKNARLI